MEIACDCVFLLATIVVGTLASFVIATCATDTSHCSQAHLAMAILLPICTVALLACTLYRCVCRTHLQIDLRVYPRPTTDRGGGGDSSPRYLSPASSARTAAVVLAHTTPSSKERRKPRVLDPAAPELNRLIHSPSSVGVHVSHTDPTPLPLMTTPPGATTSLVQLELPGTAAAAAASAAPLRIAISSVEADAAAGDQPQQQQQSAHYLMDSARSQSSSNDTSTGTLPPRHPRSSPIRRGALTSDPASARYPALQLSHVSSPSFGPAVSQLATLASPSLSPLYTPSSAAVTVEADTMHSPSARIDPM